MGTRPQKNEIRGLLKTIQQKDDKCNKICFTTIELKILVYISSNNVFSMYSAASSYVGFKLSGLKLSSFFSLIVRYLDLIWHIICTLYVNYHDSIPLS